MRGPRLIIAASCSLIIAAAGSALALTPGTAGDVRPSTLMCNNMACYGPNTCERHSGANCDLYNPSVPNGCVTTSCG